MKGGTRVSGGRSVNEDEERTNDYIKSRAGSRLLLLLLGLQLGRYSNIPDPSLSYYEINSSGNTNPIRVQLLRYLLQEINKR
ncbi:hypothetical protein J6590_052022 [Homalodisca vitripennis]|nr:hypothetical protein J6590_052022 [Homalodisca vitripennis]